MDGARVNTEDRSKEMPEFLRTLARAERASADERWQAAALLWERVTAANPVEGTFWTKLAEARSHTENFQGAIAALERGLELGADYRWELTYRVAVCHARSGDEQAALTWLGRAVDLGLRDLERARNDDAFAMRDDPAFRELVGLFDTVGLNRDEGWELDLTVFAREVKRRAYDPFRQICEERFDVAIAEIRQSVPDRSDTQILIELQKLLRRLDDGHAGITQADLYRLTVPLAFYLFKEGVFVVAAEPSCAELLGAQVLAIGEHPIDVVMAAIEPIICRDNAQGPKMHIPLRLREPLVLHALGLASEPDRLTLTVRSLAGDERRVTIEARDHAPSRDLRTNPPCPEGWSFLPETLPGPVPRYLRNAGVSFWFEELQAERIVYAQINRVRDDAAETLADFSHRLVDAAEALPGGRLVLDLRWNPGGNTFLEMALLRRVIGSKSLNRRGRLYVIAGRATFSAAQNLCTMLDLHTEAIFVGEPTGASPAFIGETVEWQLPYSKAWVNVSDLRWQFGWPMDERTWIAPTLYAPPTFAAYRANRDPALEAILACGEHLPGT